MYRRLQANLEQLRNNSNHLEYYDQIICELFNFGFIEKVPSDSFICISASKEVHYLAHHAILRDSLIYTLRIVLNWSAKASSMQSVVIP